ncbi:MAG: outer membrane protein assembly factor BamA [candidate division NC10 bacterium]|nr:outer membrane protein assembly factor BamA [candidate division NC10 bacterium]
MRSPTRSTHLIPICSLLLLLFLSPLAAAQDQPLITQIDVEGARKVEEATVRFKLKSRVGDPYSPEVVREDIKALYGLGYFEDIVVQAAVFEGGLRLIFQLHEKPSIQTVRLVGNRKLAADKIKTKIDLVEGSIVPPGSLIKNAEKIRLFYEEEGYYQAQVTGQEERISPSETAVTFNIVEGEKFDLGEIRIVGNSVLKERDIKGKLQTSELYLFFFGGTLKREELQRDLDRIRAYYLDNGFLDIVVDEPEIRIEERRRRLRVVIRVQEGIQYRIGELSIKGASLFPEAELLKEMRSQVGGIFSREALQRDVVTITDRYAERGYLFADVSPVTDIQRAQGTASVSLEISEGRQAFINRIEIVGNVRTRDKVLRRELRLVEGDVFSSQRLQAGRRSLEGLDFFEEIKLDTRRTAEADQVDLLVEVKEKATGSFSIGGGFSSVDGAMGVASISQRNLFGLGKRVALSGQLGVNANRVNFVYTDPHFLDTNFLTEVRAYNNDNKYSDNIGYNNQTIGGSLTLGHRIVEEVFASLTYYYEWVDIYNVTAGVSPLIQRQVGTTETSAMTFALARDTRDSFIEPTQGTRARLQGTYAGGLLGAENNFFKTSAEASWYHPIVWRLVGHLRGNVQYGDAFSDTPELPLQERFYLGGVNTVRGFRNFTISPKDPLGTSTLTGGNKAYFGNLELLFPVLEQMRMRGVLFFDFGNSLDERSTFGDLFSSQVRMGAGAGIRFQSPVGAIRLEWGFNLMPREGERRQVLHFTAGATF